MASSSPMASSPRASNRAEGVHRSSRTKGGVATATSVTQVLPTKAATRTRVSMDIRSPVTTGATPKTSTSAVMTGTAPRHPQTTAAAATEAATAATEAAAAARIRVAMIATRGTNADQFPKLTSGLAMMGGTGTGVAMTAGQTDHLTGVHQDHLHGKCAAMTADHHDVIIILWAHS